MKPDSDHNSLQCKHDDYEYFSEQKKELEKEISQLNEENRELQQHIDFQDSSFQVKMKELTEQVVHFETEYQTEKEDNENLRSEMDRLHCQLNSVVASSSCQHDTNFQILIRQLNKDISKLTEHSKSQSRKIMLLQQQAEITPVLLCH